MVTRHRLGPVGYGQSPVTPESLTRTVQDFLSEAAGAVVLEDGAVAFDLSHSKYSISGEYDKCLLHLWSSERNTVRRVLDAEVNRGTLKLFVQRLGQSRPPSLKFAASATAARRPPRKVRAPAANRSFAAPWSGTFPASPSPA
jgi:hypothetical protein